jgi:hypothetical protein
LSLLEDFIALFIVPLFSLVILIEVFIRPGFLEDP